VKPFERIMNQENHILVASQKIHKALAE
jgi:hypothetical protein